MTAQEQCDEWNAKYPVGTVLEIPHIPGHLHKTISAAFVVNFDDGSSEPTAYVNRGVGLIHLNQVKPYMIPAAPAPKATLDDLIREAIAEGKDGDVCMFWNTNVCNSRFGVEVNRLGIKDDRWENWSDRFRNRMRQLLVEERNNPK